MVRVVILLCLLVFSLFTRVYANDDIASVIELYKGGKYQECINKAEVLTKKDPTFVLNYYYLALSYAQLGKKDLAIKNYDKVIALGTNKSLTNYAKSGKAKLQPKPVKEKVKQVTGADFMLEDVEEDNKAEVKKVEEKPKKVEEPPKQTQPVTQKNTQKTSPKTNDGAPTNDEIVNAIRVLQRAGLLQGGLGSLSGNAQQSPQAQTPQQYAQQVQQYQQQMQQMQQSYMDPRTQELQQMLMMMNAGNNNNGYGGYNNGYDMMQMMPYLQNGGKMSPEMVKMMMMKNMMPDFSSGNNNGY